MEDASIKRWAFYDLDIVTSCAGEGSYSDTVQIVVMSLRRVTENDHYTEHADSYEEAEMYINEMLERGEKERYIYFIYENIRLDGEFEAWIEIQNGFISEMEAKYGLLGTADPNVERENDVMLHFRKS